MEKQQLKTLIAAGTYRPEPAEVAQAMLRRRAVRDLLVGVPAAGADGHGKLDGQGADGSGQLPLSPADRIQSPSAAPRQAA